jgi:hypothetical protein
MKARGSLGFTSTSIFSQFQPARALNISQDDGFRLTSVTPYLRTNLRVN